MNDRSAVGSAPTSRVRVAIIGGEAALVLALLLTWLLSEGVRTGRSLTVLFFYSFPSEFLIGLVPHEPVLLYYGDFYPAWLVALVATVSTVMAERMNYSFLSFFSDLGLFEAARRQRLVARIIRLFNRAPFAAIVFAGFTPVPFFPIRFLVVMEGYSPVRYSLGVLVSRAPRFFILAALGELFHFPGWVLLVLFLGMALLYNVPSLKQVVSSRR